MSSEAWVYQLLNAAGECIYIGCSNNPQRRLWEHRCRRPWASDIASMVVLAKCSDRAHAEALEGELIRTRKPLHNVQKQVSGDVHINLRIPLWVKERLQAMADERGVSLSQVVREALEAGLSRLEQATWVDWRTA